MNFEYYILCGLYDIGYNIILLHISHILDIKDSWNLIMNNVFFCDERNFFFILLTKKVYGKVYKYVLPIFHFNHYNRQNLKFAKEENK